MSTARFYPGHSQLNVLDRENRSSYSLLLEAYDGGSPPRSTQMTLDVSIQDINDNAPSFNQSRYHTLISENLKPGSSILQVFASDADEGDNGDVIYEINRRQSDPEQYFTIDARTGVIKLNKGLDYEMRKVHELVVQARDKAVHPEVTTAFVTIHVRDYNDNQPTMTIIFLSEDGSPQISEGAQPGQYVARISVSDPDYGEYSNVNVTLEGGDGKFALTTKDNIIYLICVDQLLDREERDSYDLRVTATDSGTPPLRAESAFVLQVMDVNDNPPLFDQQEYKQSIPEVVYPGSFVLQALDGDGVGPNSQVRYALLHLEPPGAPFQLDGRSGQLSLRQGLDREAAAAFLLVVEATDQARNVSQRRSAAVTARVFVTDENDNAPVFLSPATVSVMEDQPTGFVALHVVAQDSDLGENGRNDHAPLLERESCSIEVPENQSRVALYTLRATDPDGGENGRLDATMSVTVQVLDLNDNAPSFAQASYTVEVPEDLPVGALVLQLAAEDPDEGTNGQVSYYLGNESLGMFQVEPQSGRLRSAQALDRERQPSYSFLAMAVDAAPWEPRSAAVRVTVVVRDVNDHVPAFLHSPLTVNLSRHTPLKQVVATMRAEDRDAGANASILYRFASPSSAFAINSYTGDIQLLQPLGALSQRQRTLFVLAMDLGQPALSSTGVVVIHMQEEPYRGLRFPRSTRDVALAENAAPGTHGQ
uniref:Cadherin domain-containing protein n=1 Tax=Zonotrichia albicollis TaxID=44394 RepID=A0A8D2ML22_ZONAL